MSVFNELVQWRVDIYSVGRQIPRFFAYILFDLNERRNGSVVREIYSVDRLVLVKHGLVGVTLKRGEDVVDLSAELRREGVEGALDLRGRLDYRIVLILDDKLYLGRIGQCVEVSRNNAGLCL